MDRSYLSDPAVVAASRNFVCIRLATYESAAEAKVLESVFVGRSGQLENTVFGILEPDGKTPLVRAGRSPHMSFPAPPEESVRKMAEAMKGFAARHPGTAAVGGRLPLLADLRRGLNVAACDLQPLVGIVAANEDARKKIEENLLPLAWSPDFIGKLAYAAAKNSAEAAEKVEGRVGAEGVFVVQPDAFGLKGKLLAFTAKTDADSLRAALGEGLKKFSAEAKDSRKHIDEGVRRGIVWKTEIPVTDPLAPTRR